MLPGVETAPLDPRDGGAKVHPAFLKLSAVRSGVPEALQRLNPALAAANS